MTRRTTLTTILVFAAVAYLLLLLRVFPGGDRPVERTLGAPAGGGHRVHIYLELVGIDAVRDVTTVHVSVEPIGFAIDDKSLLPDRDLMLVMTHDKRGERVDIHAHQPMPTISIELDLHDGDIADYPLDAYRAGLSIQCFEAPALSDAQPRVVPIEVTIWEGVLGFRLRTSSAFGSVSGEDRLTLQIRRSSASTVFALAAYVAMVILACVAMTIGTLTFLHVRRAEVTFMGILVAIVFALPALRNVLPGGAPVGVLADVFIYLWAELIVVFALVLVVATWARSGPGP